MAQKTKIIHQSNFKHNYVLQRAVYLEELKDTVSCKYIATLNASSPNHALYLMEVVNLVGMRSKELGGNVFFIDSYSISDSTVNLKIKIWYAFKKVFDLNTIKTHKDKLIIFSYLKLRDRCQYFYVNDSLKFLNSSYYFKLNPVTGQEYKITACNPYGVSFPSQAFKINGMRIFLKTNKSYVNNPGKDVTFFMIFSTEFLKGDEKNLKRFSKCGLDETEYRIGRTLMEIYEPQK